ncbi:hypothetical protein MJO28_015933 [Puccinia striiformis f. sp. tritici]|uniref:Secreted protein n=4 Tax=Puccinia striiformis TaxID=27350 RepID=A0A2S4V735_9BASI|nr:hypothetical protein Pst134EA_029032 [Puccinia striiformis f. sp. tritici]KAI9617230.1 hypothetical protein H4Q26_013095 [Puccinia striiformis f. sp. tritici PST-130]POV94550.1 hypothetical protein PSTT_16801 [Puccinia striiformis]KAH9441082.1 hypothetical protein Pst134EB_029732 [Puccinia striiformis f. sp. tritici]KAH9447046.1 hypothetical protein Pst134EA_029032 [Puccinia striiformis f. sp. tritici]KAI7936154.1 hypothetical protein MJO29_015457 [Puccinia striiformis f. sp. tritici]
MFSLRVLSVVMLVSALCCIDTVTSTVVPNPPCIGKSGTPYLVCKKASENFYNSNKACAPGETGSCCPTQVGDNAIALPNGCTSA